MVAVALLVACEDQSPLSCDSIPRQTLLVGRLAELQPCFEDPQGETLVLTGASSNVETATVLVSDSAITIRALRAGRATITITAADPDGHAASIDVVIDVVGPPRLVREDFDEGLGDWEPGFGSAASHVDGMVRFHNLSRSFWGSLEYQGRVNAAGWVYKAAVGNATGNTVTGLYSFNSGEPNVYYMAIGEGSTLDSIIDANYRLLVLTIPTSWATEEDWWGRSDAIADVGELTELGLASWRGELTAWAGSTDLVKVNMAERDWTFTMLGPALVLWPTGVEEVGFADWIELWGSEGNAGADWHEGPPDIPGLPVIRTGIETGSPGIRQK